MHGSYFGQLSLDNAYSYTMYIQLMDMAETYGDDLTLRVLASVFKIRIVVISSQGGEHNTIIGDSLHPVVFLPYNRG